jgi:hypothetical protein
LSWLTSPAFVADSDCQLPNGLFFTTTPGYSANLNLNGVQLQFDGTIIATDDTLAPEATPATLPTAPKTHWFTSIEGLSNRLILDGILHSINVGETVEVRSTGAPSPRFEFGSSSLTMALGAAELNCAAASKYQQEFVGGPEFEVARSVSLGVRYIHRTLPCVLEDAGNLGITAFSLDSTDEANAIQPSGQIASDTTDDAIVCADGTPMELPAGQSMWDILSVQVSKTETHTILRISLAGGDIIPARDLFIGFTVANGNPQYYAGQIQSDALTLTQWIGGPNGITTAPPDAFTLHSPNDIEVRAEGSFDQMIVYAGTQGTVCDVVPNDAQSMNVNSWFTLSN